MRKQKFSLEALSHILPVLDEVEQRGFVGGGNGTAEDPYTFDDFLDYGLGAFPGGYVEGLGNVPADFFDKNGYGYTDSNGNNFWYAYYNDSSSNDGDYYNNSYGYSYNQGYSTPSTSKTQTITFGEYLNPKNDLLDISVKTVLDNIPFIGAFADQVMDRLEAADNAIQEEIADHVLTNESITRTFSLPPSGYHGVNWIGTITVRYRKNGKEYSVSREVRLNKLNY